MTDISKCLICYGELNENEINYHKSCSRKFFGNIDIPQLIFTYETLNNLGKKIIQSRISISGVQPKFSLKSLLEYTKNKKQLTFIDDECIIKPPIKIFPYLPEFEHLCMRLAFISKIKVVENALLLLSNGELAYITKRIDRVGKIKVPMEDFCQLSGRLTEDKYKASYELIGKLILKFSDNKYLDIINFSQVILFSFIIGNSDMHLKNFSIIKNNEGDNILSAFYDFIPSNLILPKDKEELALTLNGKKKNFTRKDFEEFMNKLKIDKKVIQNIFNRFSLDFHYYKNVIYKSYLPDNKKDEFISLISNRMKRLKLN